MEPLKILIASDSYKGCMSSLKANEQIKNGLLKADPSFVIESFPISDGGEGMVDAFIYCTQSKRCCTSTVDLYGRPIQAVYGYDPVTKTACIEAAECLGLSLYPKSQRRPMEASSYGLGLLFQKVMQEQDVRKMIVGLGGTGTNDGGMGFLEAFGARCYDARRRPLPACAASLGRVAFIDKRNVQFPKDIRITVACDVTSPLLGKDGATWVFGAQKGLSVSEQEKTEEGMRRFAAKVYQTFHCSMNDIPGSGAAGGLGGMLLAVFKACRTGGVDLLCKIGHLDDKIDKADLVITGEGQTDLQTLRGKVVYSVARRAFLRKVPVICLSGALGIGYEQLYDHGVCAMFSTADRAMSFTTAIKKGPEKLEQAARSLGGLIRELRGKLCEK